MDDAVKVLSLVVIGAIVVYALSSQSNTSGVLGGFFDGFGSILRSVKGQ